MLRRMVLGVLLGLVVVGAGVVTFERWVSPAWVEPMAALTEDEERADAQKMMRIRIKRGLNKSAE